MSDDYVTNTPEDAAIFERMHGREFEPDNQFEPDDPCEPLDVDEDDGYEHPSWCPFPPYHGVWAIVPLGDGNWLIDTCGPAPSHV